LSFLTSSIQRSILILSSGIHEKGNVNLEDLKKASFLSSEYLTNLTDKNFVGHTSPCLTKRILLLIN